MRRPSVFVVTGVPGAGKTTLATGLAAALGVPMLSLDRVKERLYAEAGGPESFDRLGLRLASEAQIRGELEAVDGSVVVDIWIAPRRDTERVAALLLEDGRDVFELLCRVPADVAVERYSRRERSGPHLPADESMLQRIRDAVEVFEPLGIGMCLEVDTSRPVDVERLARAFTDPAEPNQMEDER